MKPAFTILLLFAIGVAVAQDAPPANPRPPQGDGARMGMQMQMRGTGGTITAIESDKIKLKALDGKEAIVKISDKTVYRKDQKEAKLADFKPGDVVMVRGDQNPDGSWTAQNVISRPELAQLLAQAQSAAASGNPGGRTTMMMSGGGMSGANFQEMFEQGWAKQFVMGRVKSIEGTKIAIEGPMNKTATIEVDENTSFRQAGQSAENITLADIKPGANVFGCGAANKAGVFVPTVLTVSEQGAGMLGALAGCQNLRPQK